MKSVHQDLIDEFKNKKDKKRKSVSKISSFFAGNREIFGEKTLDEEG